MKFTIDTQKLKSMVSRAIKGAGQNKLMVLTQLMSIELKGGVLTITTTDGTNYLYIKDKVEGKDFSVTVMADQFTKLISKMTSMSTTLNIKSGVLEVSGNGNYSIELPLDETGNPITFPNPVADMDIDSMNKYEVNLTTIRTILNTVKASLSTTYEMPVLTSYYVGDRVIATDGYKVAGYNKAMLDGEEILLSAQYVDLFGVMTADVFEMATTGTETVAISDDCVIYGKQVEDIGSYPVDEIEQLISDDFDNRCIVNKQQFINLLDRMAIFVGYDNNVIKMQFNADGINISNMAGKSNEQIEYVDDAPHGDFECMVDISTLLQQVKVYLSDEVEIHYGKDNSIKLVDDEVTQVISLNE